MPYPYMNYPMAQQMPYNQPQQPQNIQNGGFISVPNIDVARNWPIAPGNSVTFKDEHAPYVYTKTMGFSQLDTPAFEVFRLVREGEVAEQQETKEEKAPEYATQSEVTALRDTVKHLRNEVDMLQSKLEKVNNGRQRKANNNE